MTWTPPQIPLAPGVTKYPSPKPDVDETFGIFPTDFIIEAILQQGIQWFRTDPKAPGKVFGHLLRPYLATEYGQKKIDEISAFINKYEIRIVQSWTMVDQTSPAISIQLMDGGEMENRAALDDFMQVVDNTNSQCEVEGRTKTRYSPINDSVHIGIHNAETPDLTKYLYYLVAYVLNLYKPIFEQEGLQLGSYRVTDLSRMNDYLPANIYSRFINFSVFSTAAIDFGDLPIVKTLVGLTVNPSDTVSEDPNLGVQLEG